LLESHYDDILQLLRNKDLLYEDLPYSDKLVYMVLGALIIKSNANLPEDLREKIIDSADWEFELKNRWRKVNDEFIEKRKKILLDFQDKIRNHKSGKLTEIDMFALQGQRYEYDWRTEKKITEVCGIDFNNYSEAHSFTPREDKKHKILTREILEKNLNEVLIAIEENVSVYNINKYLIFGALILKTGASIPEDLRQKIIGVADWEEEVKQRWNLRDEKFLEERKQVLIAFQNIVRRYKS